MDKTKLTDMISRVKDIDADKVIKQSRAAIESVDLEKLRTKVHIFTEEPAFDKLKGVMRLSKDIAAWPASYVQGLIGSFKNK